MFTNDPVRGDPSKLILNLVDGDGEKLVSGHANPTQIVISRRDLSILEKVNYTENH
jgi:phosphoenolpyruvate synthase/pyruvate phosphate dikinase